MTGTIVLDQPLHTLNADQDSFSRLLWSICGETTLGFDQAIQELQRGESFAGAGATVRDALEWARLPTDLIGERLTLLEKRDEALAAARADAVKQLEGDRLDPTRQWVMLSADADVGELLTDPATFERRYAVARRFGSPTTGKGYTRESFRVEDREMIDTGIDLVRTLTRSRDVAQARQDINETRKLLDAAIESERGHAAKVRALDAQVDELTAKRAAALQPPRDERVQAGLRLLHGGESQQDNKPLDDDHLTPEQKQLHRATHAELRRRGLDVTSFPAVLRELMEAPGGEQPSAPADRDVDLHRRIVLHLAENKLPQSDYPKILDQALTGAITL